MLQNSSSELYTDTPTNGQIALHAITALLYLAVLIIVVLAITNETPNMQDRISETLTEQSHMLLDRTDDYAIIINSDNVIYLDAQDSMFTTTEPL